LGSARPWCELCTALQTAAPRSNDSEIEEQGGLFVSFAFRSVTSEKSRLLLLLKPEFEMINVVAATSVSAISRNS
jgi:hypothetical protein